MEPISLRNLRKQRGLTQESIARLLGVTQQTFSYLESKGTVGFNQMIDVFRLLGAEVHMEVEPTWEHPMGPASEASYVYLMHHSTFPIFKVGKADDVELRTLAFAGVADIQSKFRADNVDEAFAAELILHRAFRQWRLTPEEALTIGVPEDGSTEWFESACLDRMHGFIAANQDLLRLALNL